MGFTRPKMMVTCVRGEVVKMGELSEFEKYVDEIKSVWWWRREGHVFRQPREPPGLDPHSADEQLCDLSKSLSLSEPLFLICKMRRNTVFIGLCED